jgi:hypothetical protein
MNSPKGAHRHSEKAEVSGDVTQRENAETGSSNALQWDGGLGSSYTASESRALEEGD